MRIRLKQLSPHLITHCPELCQWIETFKADQQTVVSLLLKLRFVARDDFSMWLANQITTVCSRPTAILAVRKIEDDFDCLWEEDGHMRRIESHSMGSEDLVKSVVANLKKGPINANVLDHPSISEMQDRRVHDILLLEDSIGTGQRVRDFVTRLIRQKNVYSWWNSGRLRLHVLAFSRSVESEAHILKGLPGSNHCSRKYPKSAKIRFIGELRYPQDDISKRWGSEAIRIRNFCDSIKSLPPHERLGFGAAMANVVFYHSVPDNLPGVLWSSKGDTTPLFPQRTMPEWLQRLFSGVRETSTSTKSLQLQLIDERMIAILSCVKNGLRTQASIARRLELDSEVVKSNINWLTTFGLISQTLRISEAGKAELLNRSHNPSQTRINRSLYVPSSWCADL